jgi:hypothetical protein
MKKSLAVLSLILLSASVANATGRYQCEPVAADKWLSKAQIEQKLTKAGWKVDRSKKDGGCWEVYGTTPKGIRVEGYFHPATGEQLLLSQRGREIFRKQ